MLAPGLTGTGDSLPGGRLEAAGHGTPVASKQLSQDCQPADETTLLAEPPLPDAGLWREGLVAVETGSGFFRPESRPSRDLGVLLGAVLAAEAPLTVLDAMAGCGIRSCRWWQEAGATALWVNDADPDRLPLLRRNLQPPQSSSDRLSPPSLRITALRAQKLLAGCMARQERFTLVDLDAFGSPMALVPLALEAVALDGVLVLASTDGRSPTGHDRAAAVRRLGAAARAHPASWELALRLQLGVLARAAWSAGRGLRPLFSFSEGRTFRTAVRLQRRPAAREEEQLGLVAHCHRCGDQQQQSLRHLRPWRDCAAGCCTGCGTGLAGGAWPLAISGPLWIGPLQDPQTLAAMLTIQEQRQLAGAEGERLLRALAADDGWTPRCWPTDAIGRVLGGGPPPLRPLVAALEQAGHRACISGVMPGQLRTEAPWAELLAVASGVS